jgi:hypothetical protein
MVEQLQSIMAPIASVALLACLRWRIGVEAFTTRLRFIPQTIIIVARWPSLVAWVVPKHAELAVVRTASSLALVDFEGLQIERQHCGSFLLEFFFTGSQPWLLDLVIHVRCPTKHSCL